MSAVLPRFPARVVAGAGIVITKSGLTYTIASTSSPPPTIASLTAASIPLSGSDLMPVSQGGTDKNLTVKNFLRGEAIIDKGTVTSGAVTFTQSDGNHQKVTVGAALGVTLAGFPSPGSYGEVEIELVNGGAFAVVWPVGVKWMLGDGTFSTVFADMGVALATVGTNWILVWSTDGGVNIYGRAI